MKQLWIDTDPGHDDALAILTALANKEKVNIVGISTVGGNQDLEKTTKNAQNILSFVNADIPLIKGAKGPLVKPLITAEAHGSTGMDGPVFNENDYPVIDENLIEFMYKKISSVPEKVIIVGLAPLTNIAILLKTYPEIKEKIDYISIMGGGISYGNVTPLAEFNIYVDPEAAQMVFNSGIKVVMSGLDVTEKATITIAEIDSLKNKGRVSNLAYELLKFYNESGKQFGFIDSPIHDLCAIEYIIEPSIFKGHEGYTQVITDEGNARGMTYLDNRSNSKEISNSLVLTQVDRDKFSQMLLKALEILDKE